MSIQPNISFFLSKSELTANEPKPCGLQDHMYAAAVTNGDYGFSGSAVTACTGSTAITTSNNSTVSYDCHDETSSILIENEEIVDKNVPDASDFMGTQFELKISQQ